MSCANEKCKKDPMQNPWSIRVNFDGDFVCDPECKAEYDKQKAKFFNETIHSDSKFRAWLKE